jgi:hypothetical protein
MSDHEEDRDSLADSFDKESGEGHNILQEEPLKYHEGEHYLKSVFRNANPGRQMDKLPRYFSTVSVVDSRF